ncbi:MAG: helix-turn-helix domain-containing protein [Coriobacteriaceae bacterium]|nr:helix-turn-helix domain-containing protein [Coriobacteriaceae bacterium]
MHICEFEFVEDEGSYLCRPFWPGCEVCIRGEGYGDAVEQSAGWLKATVLEAIAHNGTASRPTLGHEPKHGGRVVTLAIDASLSELPAVTGKEAAERLGVSHARISQLCSSGSLDSWTVGRTRMVTEASLNLLLSERSEAGRGRRGRVGISA